jgi:hypothetical protein
MAFFNVKAGLSGAGQGAMLGPWGALAGGVIGGIMQGDLFGGARYTQRDAVKSTSFGQAPKRSAQSAYNAPDNPMKQMGGSPAMRPMQARQPNAGLPRMPSQPNAFTNGAATMGMSANNRTYGGPRGMNPLMQRPGNMGMWPGL